MAEMMLEHLDTDHQVALVNQLQALRKEGLLCDVALKSRDGKEHHAHRAVLCAASADLKNMLVGGFQEAKQVQQGKPVDIAASDTVVSALLEFIYGGQPKVNLDDSIELLRVADAYNLQNLAVSIEAGFRACLPVAPVETALKVLQHTQGLIKLKSACEKKVAEKFESCIEHADFLGLSVGQLGRILGRVDLKVSREEVVLQGLFNWLKTSKDKGAFLGALLQNVDFQSLSSSNLVRLRHMSASMGPNGNDLQREVDEAVLARKKRSVSEAGKGFRAKRRCLKHFSPDLGASSKAPRKVADAAYSMCLHEGTIYYVRWGGGGLLCWKPGEDESRPFAREAGVDVGNDLEGSCEVSASPEGEIFVANKDNDRLVSFRNGRGNLVLEHGHNVISVFVSPNGVVYVLTGDGMGVNLGTGVQKLVGTTLQPLISSKDLPEDLHFEANSIFVTKEEVVYICDNHRILRLNPGEVKPFVAGEAPNKSELLNVFVTESEKVYVLDWGQKKVWAFHPGDAAWTEVMECSGEVTPYCVLVHGKSLYLSMVGEDEDNPPPDAEGIYEYLLPPELQLE